MQVDQQADIVVRDPARIFTEHTFEASMLGFTLFWLHQSPIHADMAGSCSQMSGIHSGDAKMN